MTPGTYNLALYRGDTYAWQFVLWEDADKTDPAALTGVTAAAQIRPAPGQTPLTELACSVVQPNIVNVALASPVWNTLAIINGFWDLQLTYPSGAVTTIVAGTVKVTLDITIPV